MKKALSFQLFIFATCLLFVSCITEITCIKGSGGVIEKNLSLGNFTDINLSSAANVYITQDSIQSVKVVGNQNIINALSTTVFANNWDISLGSGCYEAYDLKIYIALPTLRNVTLSGAGIISISDFSNLTSLTTNISGAGDININQIVGLENFTSIISGSGSINPINITGTLKTIDATISGSGTLNGYPLKSEVGTVNISGAGSCYVYSDSLLNVTISGVGNCHYKGKAKLTSKITGVGSILNEN